MSTQHNVHNHVECSLPNCQSCREFRYKVNLENENIELKNRRKWLDAMTVGPDEKGDLLGYCPIDEISWSNRDPTILKEHRKIARNTTQNESLECAINYCPDTMTDRSDDLTRERVLNLELLQRKVQREDMKIFRHEVLKLIEEERLNRREANARFRMFRVVMVQCLKMIDLWEEGCEYMDSITNKNVLIGQRKDFMNEKIDKRLGLEMDNQGLRDEISALQKRLHDRRDENNSKDNRTAALKHNQEDEKQEQKRLTGTIDKAKAGQKLLQQAMADAEVGLKDAFDTEELKELLSSNS